MIMEDDELVSVEDEGIAADDEGSPKCSLPKRPVPAFFMFCSAKKDEVPAMSLLERTQIMSQRWKNASEEEKQVFIDANAAEKQRYRNEMATLQLKHPETLKALLAKKRAKNKGKLLKQREVTSSSKGEVSSSPPKKRGRKRKRPPSPSPPPPPPTLPPPPRSPTSGASSHQSHSHKAPPHPKQVKVPGTDISIFTTEFLEYNKKLNSQLMQIRKTNIDLQSEVGRLEDSISDQEKTLSVLQDKLKTFKEEKEVLERNRQKLEDSILKSFGGLVTSDREITSAEQLLNTILANGVNNSRAVASAVKSFIIP